MAAIPFTGGISSVSPACPTLPGGMQAITPHDTNTYQGPVAVYVGGAGVVTCAPENGGADVALTMPAGSIVPGRVLAVRATGTTATLMVALY